MMMTLMKLVNSGTKIRPGIDKFYQPNSGCAQFQDRGRGYTIYIHIYIYIYMYMYTHMYMYTMGLYAGLLNKLHFLSNSNVMHYATFDLYIYTIAL